MSIYINHSTNDISTNAGARVTSGGNTVITTNEAATDAAAGIVELATTAEMITGTSTTLVPPVSAIRSGFLVSGTAITTTSGTSHSFTGIPSWVKVVTVLFSGVSTSGTDVILVQVGSGSTTTTGYLGASVATQNATATAGANYTNGFGIQGANAANVRHGAMEIRLLDGNTYVANGTFSQSNNAVTIASAGSITLGGALDRVVITTTGGTDTFDAGTINIIYE